MADSARAVSAPAERSMLARIPGVAIMFLVMAVGFALASPRFLSPDNLTNILLQSSILLLLALPMTLIIMTEGLDLSMGAVLTLASIFLAQASVSTGSFWLGLSAALAVGLAFGILNGVLIVHAGIPPFVTTLGTMGIAQGLCLIVTDGQSVVGLPKSVPEIYSGSFAFIPIPILIGVASYLGMHWLLYHTRFGTYIPALGGNREALRHVGINDGRVLIAIYALGGLMAGLDALLLTARMNAGHPTAAIGLEFDAIAAAAVGGTQFERGNGWLFGTLLGVLTIGILRNGLNLLAVPSSAQVACIGILVILALFVDVLRGEEV